MYAQAAPTPPLPPIPFLPEHQLNGELDDFSPLSSKKEDPSAPPPHLPGHPRVNLHDTQTLWRFLEREFINRDLELMAPKLWWMSKQDSASISALHRQRVKKRNIIVTEDPKLHLVWIHDRIFIKPLPEYLLSYTFWETYLMGDGDRYSHTAAGRGDSIPIPTLVRQQPSEQQRQRIRAAALGYLRTYFHLIKHESDFRVAQSPELCLVPTRITWIQWCAFSSLFLTCIKDADVSERYLYGEVRLTRLNLYAKILLRKWYFHRLHSQYGSYFGRFYAPCLFVFGILSLCLSAMQVEVSVEQVGGLGSPWVTYLEASRWFSVASLFFLIFFVMCIAGLWAYKVVQEWKYALKDRYKRGRQRKKGHV